MAPDEYDAKLDAKLAAKIGNAIKELDAADNVKKEKAIIAGNLLAEAQKRHPTDKAFEKFLVTAGGVQIRRAKDLIAIALGRKDFERHQAEHADAQQRHRDKRKAEREKAKQEQAKQEQAKQEKAKQEKAKQEKAKPERDASRDASKSSADNLREFEFACRTYLPRLNEADLKTAILFVTLNRWCPKTEKESA